MDTKLKCVACDEEAIYILDGESLCQEHYDMFILKNGRKAD